MSDLHIELARTLHRERLAAPPAHLGRRTRRGGPRWFRRGSTAPRARTDLS